jgi:hypothetical protein
VIERIRDDACREVFQNGQKLDEKNAKGLGDFSGILAKRVCKPVRMNAEILELQTRKAWILLLTLKQDTIQHGIQRHFTQGRERSIQQRLYGGTEKRDDAIRRKAREIQLNPLIDFLLVPPTLLLIHMTP